MIAGECAGAGTLIVAACGSPHVQRVGRRLFAQLLTAAMQGAYNLPPEPVASESQGMPAGHAFPMDQCVDLIADSSLVVSAAMGLIALHASSGHGPTKRKRSSIAADIDSARSGSVGPRPLKQARTGDANSTGSGKDDGSSTADPHGDSANLEGIVPQAHATGSGGSRSGSQGSKAGGDPGRLEEALTAAPPSLVQLCTTAVTALSRSILVARTSCAHQWEELMDTLRALMKVSAPLAAAIMQQDTVALLCHAFWPCPQGHLQFGHVPRATPHRVAWAPLLSTLLECLRCCDLSSLQTYHTAATTRNPMCCQERALVSMGGAARTMLCDQAFLHALLWRKPLRTRDVPDVRQHLVLMLSWNNATVSRHVAVMLARLFAAAQLASFGADELIALAQGFLGLSDAPEQRWTRVETVAASAVEALHSLVIEHHAQRHGAPRATQLLRQLLDSVSAAVRAPGFPQADTGRAKRVDHNLLYGHELASQVVPVGQGAWLLLVPVAIAALQAHRLLVSMTTQPTNRFLLCTASFMLVTSAPMLQANMVRAAARAMVCRALVCRLCCVYVPVCASLCRVCESVAM